MIWASFALAAAAFGLPWLTHFADNGLSILLVLAWIAVAAGALWTRGRRGAWCLLGAPFALYWPGAFALWLLGGAPIRMF